MATEMKIGTLGFPSVPVSLAFPPWSLLLSGLCFCGKCFFPSPGLSLWLKAAKGLPMRNARVVGRLSRPPPELGNCFGCLWVMAPNPHLCISCLGCIRHGDSSWSLLSSANGKNPEEGIQNPQAESGGLQQTPGHTHGALRHPQSQLDQVVGGKGRRPG